MIAEHRWLEDATIQVSALIAISTPAQKPRGSASRTLSTMAAMVGGGPAVRDRRGDEAVGSMLWSLMSNPTILEVVPGSPAAAAGLQPGDELLSVNGVVPTDVIEYQQIVDEWTSLVVRRVGAASRSTSQAGGSPLGVAAERVDLRPGTDLRQPLRVLLHLPAAPRNADNALSQGRRLSVVVPLRQLHHPHQIHRTGSSVGGGRAAWTVVCVDPRYEPEVRSGMLRNPRGATSLRWLRALLANGVEVHGQIVLCPDVNSGPVLEETCAEIISVYPKLASVGIVPLGLSKHGAINEPPVPQREDAEADLDVITYWQGEA